MIFSNCQSIKIIVVLAHLASMKMEKKSRKPWQYLQGLTYLKILVRIGNVGFMICVFIYCQSHVRIPGFLLIV